MKETPETVAWGTNRGHRTAIYSSARRLSTHPSKRYISSNGGTAPEPPRAEPTAQNHSCLFIANPRPDCGTLFVLCSRHPPLKFSPKRVSLTAEAGKVFPSPGADAPQLDLVSSSSSRNDGPSRGPTAFQKAAAKIAFNSLTSHTRSRACQWMTKALLTAPFWGRHLGVAPRVLPAHVFSGLYSTSCRKSDINHL